MEQLLEFLYRFVVGIGNTVSNSQFFSALVGALAGALAADRIATSSKRQEGIEAQIRAVNIAISTSFLICNSLLVIKKDHVAPLYKDYNALRDLYLAAQANPPPEPITIKMDFKEIGPIYLPIEILSKNVYEIITVTGRPLALVSTLASSIENLRAVLQVRERVSSEFKKLLPANDESVVSQYFGLALANGAVNQEYLDAVHGIYKYTDDVIYFSSLLCKDLEQHGQKLRRRYHKKYKRKIDEVVGFDFDTVEAKSVWPNEDEYRDWNQMFVQRENEVIPWYKRIFGSQ